MYAHSSCSNSIYLHHRTRCGDGSCREAGRCPAVNTCPSSRPYRCSSGQCAESMEYCISPTTGCPSSQPVRCELSGLCYNPLNQVCNVIVGGANACPADRPFKCDNGECTVSQDQCLSPSGCDLATPFRCLNGNCVADTSLCAPLSSLPTGELQQGDSVDDSGSCPTGLIRCADGSCVDSW